MRGLVHNVEAHYIGAGMLDGIGNCFPGYLLDFTLYQRAQGHVAAYAIDLRL